MSESLPRVLPVDVVKLPNLGDLPLPQYHSDGAAAMDVHAAIEDWMILEPGQRMIVPTGIAVAIPPGYELQVRPRSGIPLKHGVIIANAPGTIDSDFRGEVGVILLNTGDRAFQVRRGDRIAQILVAPVLRAEWHVVDALPETARGAGGFGSTGR